MSHAADTAFEELLSTHYMPRNPIGELHTRMDEYLEWYTANHQRYGDIVDVHKRLEFLDKAVGGSLFLINLAAQEIARLNGSQQRPRLWMPPAWRRGT